MKGEQLNIRISAETRTVLRGLCAMYREGEGEVIARLVERARAEERAHEWTEADARWRVGRDKRLQEHEATIFSDWHEADHIEWVCVAPVDEIIDWAESVEHAAAH